MRWGRRCRGLAGVMKVAVVIERLETWRGGAETSTVQFAGHLARLGCEVHMITTSQQPSTPELRIVPIRANGALRGARTLVFARRAARYVREHSFDIVHGITPCVAADVYQPRGGTVPETLERNLAMRPRGGVRGLKRVSQQISLKYQVVAGLERRLLKRQPSPWVIAISDYVTRQLGQHYGLDGSRVRRIFNGVDPDVTPAAERVAQRADLRLQFGLADDDLVLLCVAHNFKLKGVAKLIEALALRRQGRAKGSRADRTFAVIVGHDNPRSFARLAQRLGVADRVLFAGSTQRMPAFLHGADVLVHPTYYDPCSRVVLEAMAAGLPAVTTRYNGAAELITEGREGYVIDSPEDVAALADRIERLADEKHRRECARWGPLTTEPVTMRAHAERVLALYEELIASGECRRGGYR